MTRRFRFDGEAESFVNQPGEDVAVGLVSPGQTVDADGALADGLAAHGEFTEIGGAEASVKELDVEYGHLDGYPKSGKKAEKVAFVKALRADENAEQGEEDAEESGDSEQDDNPAADAA